MSRPTVVSVFGRTDVGRTREHNEDAFVVADLTRDNATLQPEVRTHEVGPRGTLFMVADGMGGAAAGEVASALAIETVLGELREHWIGSSASGPEAFAAALRDACIAANSRIHRFAAEHPEHRGMGSTATIVGLLGDRLYLAQVGDSRAYLVRQGAAIQLTKDQSLVQKLVEAGELTVEEAELSERRNIILQALGPEAKVKVDLTSQLVRRGDTLILCSDGLSGQVKGDAIARTATAEPDLMAICKKLIDQANENGGPDNITVIAARFDGEGLDDALTSDAIGHQTFRFSSPAIIAASDDEDLVITQPVPTVEIPRPTVPMSPVDLPPSRRSSGGAQAATIKRDATPVYLILAAFTVVLAVVLFMVYRR
jgi:protein phosphatase